MVPHLPLLICLRALHPVRAFTGNNIQGRLPKEAPLNQKALVTIPWSRGIQHVKHCRVKEQRLTETCYKEWSAKRDIHDMKDERIRLHLANGSEDNIPRAWAINVDPLVHQISKQHDTVDNEYLIRVNVQVINTNCVPPHRDAVELEWHTELTSIIHAGLGGSRAGGDQCQ